MSNKDDNDVDFKVQDKNQKSLDEWLDNDIDEELEGELIWALKSLFTKHDLHSIDYQVHNGEVSINYSWNKSTDGWKYISFDI